MHPPSAQQDHSTAETVIHRPLHKSISLNTSSTTYKYNSNEPSEAICVLQDCLQFMTLGMEALANDEFTRCFKPKVQQNDRGRTTWMQLLLRACSACVRYGILFPLRLSLLLTGSFFFFALLPLGFYFQSRPFMNFLFLMYNKVWVTACGARLRHHGVKPRLDQPSIFVANHTSFIDYFVLSSHQFAHATVAQQHGGIMGVLQTFVLTMNGSLMFRRADKSDRHGLANKMKAHVHQRSLHQAPLLIFPEGTCVNNEYTVLFHRGAFALDAVVCPVAIKYDKHYADPYWMSSKQSFTQHILHFMTSWSLVADVYWLPPQTLQNGETPTDFAFRVKQLISERAGLTCLSWDGYWKNFFNEEKRGRLKSGQQSHFANGIRARQRERQRRSRGSGRSDSSTSRSSSTTGSRAGSPDPLLHMTPSTPPRMSVPAMMKPTFPVHWTQQQVVEVKNQMLMMEMEDQSRSDLMRVLNLRQKDVVETWKKFTRVKETLGAEEERARRIENSTWRLWFKDQLERQPPLTTECKGKVQTV